MLEGDLEDSGKHPLGKIFSELILNNIYKLDVCRRRYYQLEFPSQLFFENNPFAERLKEEALEKLGKIRVSSEEDEFNWGIKDASQKYFMKGNLFRS